MFSVPHFGGRELAIKSPLRFGFIVDRVKPNDSLKENMKLRMGRGVLSYFKQGLENVLVTISVSRQGSLHSRTKELRTADNILETVDQPLTLVNFIQSRNLNQPSNIMRDELIVDDPFCKIIPFVHVAKKNDKLKAI